MNSLFKKPVMWLLLGNDLLDNLGIWIRNMAILLYVGRVSNYDPIAIAMVALAELLPMFLFSMIGGAVADRWEPKRTIILGGLLSALSIGLIAFVVAGGFWEGVFAALVVSAIASQFSQPSSMVVFKRNLSPEETGIAISIDQTLVALLVIIGPIVGTGIFLAFGIVASLIVVLALFLVSTALAAFLPKMRDREKPLGKFDLIGDIKESLRYMMTQRRLKIILATLFAFGFGNGIIQPLDLLLIKNRLHLDDSYIQWLTMIIGVGMIAGGLLSSVTTKLGDFRGKMIFAFCVMGLSVAGNYLSLWFPLTASLHFTNGLAIAFLQAGLSTVSLTWVKEDFVGRVSGLIVPVMTGAICVGSSLSGPIVTLIGLVPTGLVASGIMLIGGSILLCLRKSDLEAVA